jgi:hypothetical protein
VGAEVIGRNECVIEIEILERILVNINFGRAKRQKKKKKLVLSQWALRVPRRGQLVH